ncbi:uncharacterized protein PHALS_15416 [Plasmopara halstedii]|uniref:Uncharacterized protein n=1 Tax=Plasmopara halstedii TaxID=4781 RepID=A0A0P1AGE1_PLAHL|nr:uncharacterized protein PHALS_15416 [Plasmopara halstedii]CEG39986.1 hypothetical protein PHALS_15416 [Plasmopara halstedii]|eukprot:XP_024576355.1 hypothetical protein PHALS_15416 [Plasmopara halstedii]
MFTYFYRLCASTSTLSRSVWSLSLSCTANGAYRLTRRNIILKPDDDIAIGRDFFHTVANPFTPLHLKHARARRKRFMDTTGELGNIHV